MPFICPYCANENLDPSTFCVHCGKKLPSGQTDQPSEITGKVAAIPPTPYTPRTPPATASSFQRSPSFTDEQDWDATLSPSKYLSYQAPSIDPNARGPLLAPEATTPLGVQNRGPVQQPLLTPSPDTPVAPSAQHWTSPHPPYPAPPLHPQAQQWGAPATVPSPLTQTGNQALASLRRAFAGYGIPITHHSWLLEGKKGQEEAVVSTIKEKLKQEHYSGSTIKVEKLSEHNPTQEVRDFLVIQRASVTELIYVAPADDALYLSRTTVVQPSLSYVRVGILAILLLIVVIGPFIAQVMLRSALTGTQPGFPGTDITSLLVLLQQAMFYSLGFSLLYNASLFFLACLLLTSVISWLHNKDSLMYLRTNRLHDFQIDDVALLERVTDRAVRNAVDQAGLDATQIVLPAQGYHSKRKIRFI
jgi:hypothetical protein